MPLNYIGLSLLSYWKLTAKYEKTPQWLISAIFFQYFPMDIQKTREKYLLGVMKNKK